MHQSGHHNIRYLLAVILCLVCLVQCAHLSDFITRPVISYDTIIFKNMSFTEATAVFRFNVYNPNAIGMSIKEIGYDLDVNSSNFLSGVLNDGLSLPASGSSVFEVPVRIEYIDFFRSVRSFLSADSLDYDLGGYADFSMFRVPYKKSGRLPVPKLPSIRLKQFHVQKMNLTGAKIDVQIGLKNSNSFAVDPGVFEYSLSLAGVRLSSGRVRAAALPGNNEESIIHLPLDVNFLSVGTALAGVLTGKKADYSLDASFHVNDGSGGEKIFPVRSKGTIDLR